MIILAGKNIDCEIECLSTQIGPMCQGSAYAGHQKATRWNPLSNKACTLPRDVSLECKDWSDCAAQTPDTETPNLRKLTL